MKPYIGPSESQSNAEALARRGSPYTVASGYSVRIAWDFHQREPATLREAVRAARRAYSDEVPDKLHDGPDAIGDDGTPRMTAKAVGYIFGSASSDDAGRDPETGERDLVGYHYTPFRAQLERMSHASEKERLYAAIVQKVTIGGHGPGEAALALGVRPECIAKGEAFMALRWFLRGLTDMRVHAPRVQEADSAVA